MRGIKFVLIVALAIAGLALGTGVGASTGKPAAAAKSPQIRDVIIKGNVQSLGPIPARVDRLMKRLRAGDGPAFSCSGATTHTSSAAAQTCVWPSSYTGQVTCIQTSTSPTVVQTCDTTQTGSTQANRALIIQIIWSMNPHAAQDGKQIVRLRQTNVSGSNNAGIGQYIKQAQGPGTPDDSEEGTSESLASPTASAVQTQESHQTVHLRQVTTGAGDNNAVVLQFLRQRARASNVGTVNQTQNVGSNGGDSVCAQDAGSDALTAVTVDPNANQCVLSNQISTGGHLNLGVNQDYNQFQRARKAGGGFQRQGVDNPFGGYGGGDIGLAQVSPAQSNILTNQNERLVQRAIDSTTVNQDQNGPRKGAGSSQGTDPGDIWKGFQNSDLIQTNTTTGLSLNRVAALTPGHQSDFLQYFGDTSGDIRATQTSNINGAVTSWGCPMPGTTSTGPNPVCAAEVKCEAGNLGRSRSLQAVASACTPACPEGMFFDPGTGTCRVFDTSTPTSPSYARRR